MDPNSLTFKKGDITRAAGNMWSGWFVWVYGLQAGDRLDCMVDYVEEIISYTGSYSTNAASTRNSSATTLDRVTQTIENLVEKGLTAWSTASKVGGVALDITRKIFGHDHGGGELEPGQIGTNLRRIPPMQPTPLLYPALTPTHHFVKQPTAALERDEEVEMKEYEALRQQQASRASIASAPPARR